VRRRGGQPDKNRDKKIEGPEQGAIYACARAISVARGAWRVARGAWRVARGAWRVALDKVNMGKVPL